MTRGALLDGQKADACAALPGPLTRRASANFIENSGATP